MIYAFKYLLNLHICIFTLQIYELYLYNNTSKPYNYAILTYKNLADGKVCLKYLAEYLVISEKMSTFAIDRCSRKIPNIALSLYSYIGSISINRAYK